MCIFSKLLQNVIETDVNGVYIEVEEKKEEILLCPMTKSPNTDRQIQKQNTKTPPKTLIT